MKKLMIALATVALAIGVQAAQVSWATGKLYNPNADGTWSSVAASSSVGTWLATVTFYSDNDGVKGELFAPGGTLTASTINGMTGGLGASAGGASSGFAFGTDYWAVLELSFTGDTGVAQTLTLDPYKFQTKGTGSTPLNFTTVGALDSSHTFTPAQAAPEPTSGLLLLLGMAGLALKRKRA